MSADTERLIAEATRRALMSETMPAPVSYAWIVGRHAAQAAMTWPNMPHCPARESMQVDAAALAELARRLEQLQGLRLDYSLLNLAEKSRTNDWNQTSHIGYHDAFETLHEVITALRAGYLGTPPRDD